MADSHLFEDSFNLSNIQDKKYDRVIRIEGTSTDLRTKFTLDVNNELFPVTMEDSVQLLLASTLKLDGSKDDMKSWTPAQKEVTLADTWDYVMFGKVYRFLETDEQNVIKVFVSFGGLLLYLEGPYQKLVTLKRENVFLLAKK